MVELKNPVEEDGVLYYDSIDENYSIIKRKNEEIYLPYVFSQKENAFIWTEDYCQSIDESIQSMLKFNS